MEEKILKKKLFYSSTHRGCKEMDILLGSFASSHLDKLTAKELIEYSEILKISDDILYKIFIKKIDYKEEKNSELFKKIIDHCYASKNI